MAGFNPQLPDSNPPSFLGYSQRNSGQEDVFKTLFGGIARTAELAAGAIDFSNKSKIEDQLTTAVDAIQGPLYRSGQSLIEPATTTTTAGKSGTLNSEDAIADPNTMPSSVKKPLDTKLTTLKTQQMQGVLPDTLYFTQLDALVRNMKNKYPLYSDEIDKMIRAKTGHNPAESLRSAINQDAEKYATALKSARSKDDTFVDQNSEWIQKVDPTFIKKWESGEVTDLGEIKVGVAKLKSIAHDTDLATKEIAFAKANNSLTQDNARSTAQRVVDNYVVPALNNQLKAVQKQMDDLTKTPGALLKTEDVAALSTTIKRLKAELGLEIDKILTQEREGTDGKSWSFNSVMKTEDAVAIKNQALARLDLFDQAINDNRVGLIQMNANILKGQSDTKQLELIKAVPGLLTVMAAREIGGPNFIDALASNKAGSAAAKFMQDTGNQLIDFVSGVSVLGGSKDNPKTPVNGTPTDLIKFLKSNPAVPANRVGAVAFNTISSASDFITKSPDHPDSIVLAKFLFSDTNDFLINYNSADKQRIFNMMASESMTASMKKIGEKNPELWQAYTTWTTDLFTKQSDKTLNSIKSNIDNKYLSFSVDTKTGMLKAELWPDWKALYDKGPITDADRYGINQTKSIVDEVGKFNETLTRLNPIMKEMGVSGVEKVLSAVNERLPNLNAPQVQGAQAPSKPGTEEFNRDFMVPLGKNTLPLNQQLSPGNAPTSPIVSKEPVPQPRPTERNPEATLSTDAGDSLPPDLRPPLEVGKSVDKRTIEQYTPGMEDDFLRQRIEYGKGIQTVQNLQPEFKTGLSGLMSAADAAIGKGLGIGSGYRSTNEQTALWARSDRSGKMVAAPGHSKHEKGQAVDLTWNGQFLNHAPANVIRWVHEHAAEFGLHFPMSYEAWHVEPIGSRDLKKQSVGGTQTGGPPLK